MPEKWTRFQFFFVITVLSDHSSSNSTTKTHKQNYSYVAITWATHVIAIYEWLLTKAFVFKYSENSEVLVRVSGPHRGRSWYSTYIKDIRKAPKAEALGEGLMIGASRAKILALFNPSCESFLTLKAWKHTKICYFSYPTIDFWEALMW